MRFDPEEHLERLKIIQRGRELFPGEKNISVLYKKTCAHLGIEIKKLKAKEVDHLPTPQETGPFFKCPKCDKETLLILGLCGTCKDAEGGKFKTKLECGDCGFKELSQKFVVQVLNEHGFDFKTQTKRSLGIKTLTDEGVK